MKKIIFILFLIIPGVCQLQAQNNDKEKHSERIKSLKTAFITQELNLSKEEAQQFWPIYNAYDAKKQELRRREHRDLPNIECIDEAKAEKMLQEFVEIEKQDYVLKKRLFQDLREIISSQQLIHLQKLEDEFHKKLLKEYRARKERGESEEE